MACAKNGKIVTEVVGGAWDTDVILSLLRGPVRILRTAVWLGSL